jgi:TRAP-type C4-dicarboxylate transport system permease small subunit
MDMTSGNGWETTISAIKKAAWAVERIAAIPCMIGIGVMTVIVIFGVFFRYVLITPIGWTEEAARYVMIWAASLAISMGIMKGEHVGLTFIFKAFPPRFQRVIGIGVNLSILYFLWVLTERGFWMALNGTKQISSLLGVSMMWSLAAIPISGLLAMLQTIFLIFLLILENPQAQEAEPKGT